MIRMGSGKLYIGTIEGGILGEIKDIETAVDAVDMDEITIPSISINGTIKGSLTIKPDRHLILSLLLGRKVTNNWLRMHGGIMSRKVKR